MKIESTLPSWHIRGKRVLLRADLNVPLDADGIIHDYRLAQVLPTIKHILENGGKLIIIAHLGRPEKTDSSLSLKRLIPWFEDKGYTIDYAPTLDAAIEKSTILDESIVLLENIRFFPEEYTRDAAFAQKLAKLGDFFVNDAFGALHRNDTSVTLLPQHFTPDTCSVGLLVEKEIKQLGSVITHPAPPFILILGGKKLSDKIPLLTHLLDKVQTIILCPAIVFTFLKAQGKPVGASLVDESLVTICSNIIQQAHETNVSILMPLDYQVADTTYEGELSYVDADEIKPNDVGISIGPKTIELFTQEIDAAGTIFFNGAMGFAQRKETLDGVKDIFRAMAQASGKAIIAGGDSVAIAQHLDIGRRIDHLSTGGGAALAYVTSKQLPGLNVLID